MKKPVTLLLALLFLAACLVGCGKAVMVQPEAPAETSTEAPLAMPSATPAATSAEAPLEAHTETPAVTPTEAPAETPEPVEESAEGAADARTAEAIIEEIILYHGYYGQQAGDKVEELLGELDGKDRRQGELWRNIVAYWSYANAEMEVNLETIPEGLPDDDSLCIAVLGFELNRDGTMKEELIGRLTAALSCAEQYPRAYVLCTGGGSAKDKPEVTEAGLMGEWLLQHGLEKERLILEDKSRTTASNAERSYEILRADYPQVDAVVIVSSDYHIAWGAMLFEAAFLKEASEKQTPGIHVISNFACPVVRTPYRESQLLRWEAGGLMELIGREDLAMLLYYNRYEKPAL